MAFFDEVGKKISQAGQTTIQITKLSAQINDDNDKLDKLYCEMGKLYVYKHADDSEDDFKPVVEEIKRTQQQIQDMTMQMQSLKGLVQCPKCGAMNASDYAFCSSCGESLPRPQVNIPQNAVFCTKCGGQNQVGVRFCMFCGNPMSMVNPGMANHGMANPGMVNPDIPAEPASGGQAAARPMHGNEDANHPSTYD